MVISAENNPRSLNLPLTSISTVNVCALLAEVCTIFQMVYDTTKHSTALCDWLEANKPAKPKAAKVAKAIKTMSAQKRRGLFQHG